MRSLDDAKALAPEDRSLLLACKRIIQGFDPGATILLYGSVARGTGEPDSDYDVLVLTARPLSTAEQDRVRDAVYDLELDREAVISLLFCTVEEWETPLHRAMPLHQNVQSEGIVV